MLKLKLITGLVLLCIVSVVLVSTTTPDSVPDPYLENVSDDNVVNSSPSIQMYFYIKKYAEKFSIPEPYAFSLAYQETRYGGPLDLNYNHKQKSYAGALGPMQIMPATAKLIYGESVPKTKLMSDINLNVMISMKLLRRLYDKYNDWGLVFGAYNTGRPCVNGYARNILAHQYIWDELKEI
jgi:soluble lytic murein transglycosylase-like protein